MVTAGEGRIHRADLRLRLPRLLLSVGPWQYGDSHGWRVGVDCRHCRAWYSNSPGPTLLLAVVAARASLRQHRPYCFAPAKREKASS